MTNPAPPVFVSTMESERFEVFHSYVPVPKGLRLHTHDHFEVNCVLHGTSLFYLDGKTYKATPGTVLIISPGAIHNVTEQLSASYERLYLHINKSYLEQRSTPNTNLTACFSRYGKPANRILTLKTAQLHKYLDGLLTPPTQAFGSDLAYEEHFLSLMVMLNEAATSSEGSEDRTVYTNKASSRSRLITTVTRYVDENLAGDLSLDAISAHCFVNKYYLSRQFKKEMGMNLSRFILLRRLQHSKWLLPQLGSANEVYRACGFKSYTHFLRSFQNEFNMTTTQYLERSSKSSTQPR